MDCPAEDHSFLEEMTIELRPEGQVGFIQGNEEEREFLARGTASERAQRQNIAKDQKG